MRLSLGFWVSAAVILAAADSPPKGKTYSTWLADSAILRGQGHGINLGTGQPQDSYEHGTFQRALTVLHAKTGNQAYLDYIKEGIDNVVADNGTVGGGYALTNYILDDIKIGQSLIQLYVFVSTY